MSQQGNGKKRTHWRPLRGQLFGPGHAVAELLAPRSDEPMTFFAVVLRMIRALSSPSGTSCVGTCVPGIFLRRAFVASIGEFSGPCRAGRDASVGHSSQSFASRQKSNGGEANNPTNATGPEPYSGLYTPSSKLAMRNGADTCRALRPLSRAGLLSIFWILTAVGVPTDFVFESTVRFR